MNVTPEPSRGGRSSADRAKGRAVMIGTALGLVAFGIVLIVLGSAAIGIVLIVLAPVLMLLTSRD